MNKNGNLNVIQKKLTFSEKGVIEYEDGKKEGRQKEIVGFNRAIESQKTKNKSSKLPWIKQRQKYLYRLIMKDKNGADKAIYF